MHKLQDQKCHGAAQIGTQGPKTLINFYIRPLWSCVLCACLDLTRMPGKNYVIRKNHADRSFYSDDALGPAAVTFRDFENLCQYT